MLETLKNAIASFREPGALAIQMSDEWRRTRHETRWTYLGDVNGSVKLKKELVEEHERPADGEVATLVRVDGEVEWFDLDNREEWPEYVEPARECGVVFEAEIESDPLAYMWPALMSNSGSTWRRED